jgi:hypothetical protein
VGRVANADVVEDGLTEDVPSSMVNNQKSRRHLYVVKSQDRFGKVTAGGYIVVTIRPSSGFCILHGKKRRKNLQKMENNAVLQTVYF